MSQNIESHVTNLRGIIPNLPAKSQNFAESLCRHFDKKGSLSPKQLYWVERLYQENKTGQRASKTVRMANEPAEVKILRAHAPLLINAKNQKFADDLVRQWDNRGFISRKQQFWLEKLAEMAAEAAASQPVEVGLTGYGAVTELIARSANEASKKLKEPSVTLWVEHDGHTQELRIRQPSTRKSDRLFNPAEDLVVEQVQRTVHATRSQTFHGIINKLDDSYYHAQNTPTWIVDTLEDFKNDPISTLAEMGRIAGRCTFCSRKLEDERSTAHGYGPICAKRYSLPWSTKTARPIIQQIHAHVNLKALEIRPGVWAVIDLDTNTIVQTFPSRAEAMSSADEWSKVEHQPETN